MTTPVLIGPDNSPTRNIGFTGDARPQPLIAEIVEVMLFTEARADASQVEPGDDPRGWWHDGLGEPIGSTIWAFRGAPLVDETLRAIEQAATKALQPLLAQGLASTVTATAEATGGFLALTVGIIKPDGTSQTLRWPNVWAGV